MEPPAHLAADDNREDSPRLNQIIWVCRVEQPGEAPQDVVTLLPPEVTFQRGIIPEAIIGVLRRPLREGETIEPGNFVRNKVFNDFLHEFIAIRGHELDGLQSEARRQGEGWVYLIDARTANPQGHVPPQDIIGAFEVKAGRIVPQSYKRSPNHLLLSQDGIFRLATALQERLRQELTERSERHVRGCHFE